MNRSPDSSEKKGLILLVDDVPENIRLLGMILKKEGYALAFSENGKEMEDTLKRMLPDMILLDIMLPDADGITLCENLKKEDRTAGIPVIFLTAKSAGKDKIRGFRAGAVDYITKPFEESEVLARVHAHMQLQKSKDMIFNYCRELERSNRTKDKLFSVIGHDLRGSFAGMHSFIRLMKKNAADEIKREKYIRNAEESLSNTLELLDNLLKWARTQRDDISYSPVMLDIRKIIDKCIALSEDAAKEKEIRLYARISEAVSVFADKDMLMTIMRNLISNAIKFTPLQGEIRITAVSRKKYSEISVRDSGIGIGKAEMEKLFSADHSIVRRGTQGEKGSGLGLILIKEFVEKNRGNIRVESESGKGSCFIVTLPAVSPPDIPSVSGLPSPPGQCC